MAAEGPRGPGRGSAEESHQEGMSRPWEQSDHCPEAIVLGPLKISVVLVGCLQRPLETPLSFWGPTGTPYSAPSLCWVRHEIWAQIPAAVLGGQLDGGGGDREVILESGPRPTRRGDPRAPDWGRLSLWGAELQDRLPLSCPLSVGGSQSAERRGGQGPLELAWGGRGTRMRPGHLGRVSLTKCGLPALAGGSARWRLQSPERREPETSGAPSVDAPQVQSLGTGHRREVSRASRFQCWVTCLEGSILDICPKGNVVLK